jgi:hypothetical protein
MSQPAETTNVTKAVNRTCAEEAFRVLLRAHDGSETEPELLAHSEQQILAFLESIDEFQEHDHA